MVFIGGLMSDEGSTGGDIFQVPAGGGAARNLTPGIEVVRQLSSRGRSNQQAAVLHRALRWRQRHFATWTPPAGQIERLWQGDESINPPFDDSGISMSADGKHDGRGAQFLEEAARSLGRPDGRVERQ